MNRRSPDTKTILIYFLILVTIVAVVSLVLGAGGWLRIGRTLLLYAGVFFAALYVLRRLRR